VDRATETSRTRLRLIAQFVAQVLLGVLASPFLVAAVYQIVARVDIPFSQVAALLVPLLVFGSVAGAIHWKLPPLRVFAWSLFSGSSAFHLWFEFVVVASLPGPDF
jgi:hypothetical protein